MIKVKIFDDKKFVRTVKGNMFVGVIGTEHDDGYESQIALCGRSSGRGAFGMMEALADATKHAAADMAEASEQISESTLLLAHLAALAGDDVEEKEDE